jgi:hypothetical protein
MPLDFFTGGDVSFLGVPGGDSGGVPGGEWPEVMYDMIDVPLLLAEYQRFTGAIPNIRHATRLCRSAQTPRLV